MKKSALLPKKAKIKVLSFLLSIFFCLPFLAFCPFDCLLAEANSEKPYLEKSFYSFVSYQPDHDRLYFTIPETIPPGYRFYLHVSGRIWMNNLFEAMSFHAFEEESLNFSWIPGKTYAYYLESDHLVECLLVFGLIDEHGQEFLSSIRIFPNGSKTIKRD